MEGILVEALERTAAAQEPCTGRFVRLDEGRVLLSIPSLKSAPLWGQVGLDGEWLGS